MLPKEQPLKIDSKASPRGANPPFSKKEEVCFIHCSVCNFINVKHEIVSYSHKQSIEEAYAIGLANLFCLRNQKPVL